MAAMAKGILDNSKYIELPEKYKSVLMKIFKS
jgi:hypothetical protein